MGRGLVRLAPDEYVEWSTVVDAPVTYAMDRAAAVAYYSADSVSRADHKGTSFIAPAYTLADLVEGNRAGPHESCASLDQIRMLYRDLHP